MVGVTGCGCPVDTSVHSTEAPTETAAETLNPWLPLAVPEILCSLTLTEFRPLRHPRLASSSTGCASATMPGPSQLLRSCKRPWGKIQQSESKKSTPTTRGDVLFLVGVTGLEPMASWSRTKRDTKLRHTPIFKCSSIIY